MNFSNRANMAGRHFGRFSLIPKAVNFSGNKHTQPQNEFIVLNYTQIPATFHVARKNTYTLTQ